MNKFIKDNKIIIVIIIFFLICLFLGPPFIKHISETKGILPAFQIITKDNYEAWISYYGAIIGGALTLLGVWWTLREQAKDRRNDLDNSNFPSLLFDLKYPHPEKEEYNKQLRKIFLVDSVRVGPFDKSILYLPMFIINHDVPIFDLYLKKADIHLFGEEEIIVPLDIDFNTRITATIPTNTKIGCTFYIPINGSAKSFFDNNANNGKCYNIELIFTYKNKYKFKHSTTIVFCFDHFSKENDIYYTNKTTYTKFIKEVK